MSFFCDTIEATGKKANAKKITAAKSESMAFGVCRVNVVDTANFI